MLAACSTDRYLGAQRLEGHVGVCPMGERNCLWYICFVSEDGLCGGRVRARVIISDTALSLP